MVEDVFAQEYISGEGIQFFGRKGEHSFQQHWANQTIGTKECDRSLLAFATKMSTEKIKALPCCIDLLGDFPDQIRSNLANTVTVENAREIEQTLGISGLRSMRDAEVDSFLKNMTVSCICYGSARKFDLLLTCVLPHLFFPADAEYGYVPRPHQAQTQG